MFFCFVFICLVFGCPGSGFGGLLLGSRSSGLPLLLLPTLKPSKPPPGPPKPPEPLRITKG